MIDLVPSMALLPVLVFPLLLLAMVAVRVTRAVAMRLVPWAALPALVAAVIVADGGLRLPGVLLNGMLTLDATGRAFLLLNAVLWLASGLLDGFREQSAATVQRALLYLLAMTGAVGMTLAGDAVMFFTATTLAGYALYGLLVSGADAATQRAGRLLVVLLVVSDLLVFEVLLLLGHTAGETGFPALRAAFQVAESQGLLLGLLIAGFGIKGGVIGLHVWMRPVFETSRIALLPVLTGFAISGLLGWLRLLPLGEIAWPFAGDALQWLAWIGLGYVVLAGIVQSRYRALLVYAVIALSGLWLSALGTALRYQQTWSGLFEVILATAPQAGFVLSALLLSERGIKTGIPAWRVRLTAGLLLLAAATLVLAPLGGAMMIAGIDADGMRQMYGVAAVITFLFTRALLLFMSGKNTQAAIHVDEDSAAPVLLLAGVLAVGALLIAVDTIAGMPLAELQWPVLVIIVAAFFGWLSVAGLAWITPVTGFPGLRTAISRRMGAVADSSRALLDMQSLRRLEVGLRLARRSWLASGRWSFADRIELGFKRWHTAMIMLVLLGGLLAWLSGN